MPVFIKDSHGCYLSIKSYGRPELNFSWGEKDQATSFTSEDDAEKLVLVLALFRQYNNLPTVVTE